MRQFALVLLAFLFLSRGAAAAEPELVIYTYDSMLASDALGPAIFPVFEKKYKCRIKALPSGDGGQLLTRLQLDAKRGKPSAHIILGIDQLLWDQTKPFAASWGKWVPAGFDKLNKITEIENGFLPYDYGYLSMMVDHERLRELKINPDSLPRTLDQLLDSTWKRNIILQDPRTSTPAMVFLLFTQSVYGGTVSAPSDSWKNFWRGFKKQWLTLTPGWSAAYQLFLKKEAPMVWSYLTSQAYHEEHLKSGGSHRYQALLFKEGQPIQVEGAALVQGAFKTPKEEELARHFLEFLISPEVQSLIPKKNWMFPARDSVDLPESFRHLPRPVKSIPLRSSAQESEQILKQWNSIVSTY